MFRALVALLAWAAGCATATADERILSFDETITVNSDGSLYLREVIRVRAEGNKIRRGIYRDFPTIYRGSDGTRYVVDFSFQGASLDGQWVQSRVENRDNGVRIYLGDPSSTVARGEHTYEIVFRTDRQMGFFANHDELYWNVTGNGWDFPIDRATARVELPPGIPANEIKLEAYTGPQGSKGQDYTARMDNGVPLFATTRKLGPRHGLTIVVMFPKGFIMPAVESPASNRKPWTPSGTQNVVDAGRHGWSPAERILGTDLPNNGLPAVLGLLGLALLLTYYYLIWARVGRDPPGRIAIPEYEFPKGQSPASMRYLLRMRYDDECFAAAVLSLAVKGHLVIHQDAGVLGFGRKFTLVREHAAGAKALSADEQQLLAGLFAGGDTLVLENENHERVSDARKNHRLSIRERYTSGFFDINGGWHALGIVLSLVLAAPAALLPGRADIWPEWHFTTPGGWFTLFTVLAMLVANGVFGILLRAPTVAGQAIMDHIRGFKMYLEVAEGEDLRKMKGPPPPMTPHLFESYLPAALALEVEQRWAERFAGVLNVQAPNYTPAWYAGPGWNSRDLGGFSRDLGSSLGSAISSAATAPGSSSGGGGSGSSGGGGGGGGGGGW
ncbi:MAG TPA: DUF2207 domain-containing protein [Steroidobacteraceae bacterium]|nr:DUF2207 domain-containing protein [Steroidobacteraceae bacterium]